MTTYDRDHLPAKGWAEWRKTATTRMSPLVGPCTIVTKEGPVTLPDGWQGQLALDTEGYPYPVDASVHKASYEPA